MVSEVRYIVIKEPDLFINYKIILFDVNNGINTYNYVLSNPLTFVDIFGLGPAEGDTGGGPVESGSSCSSILTPHQLSSWGITLISASDQIIIKNSITGQILSMLPKAANILSTGVNLLDAALANGVVIVVIERNLKDYYLARDTSRYLELHSMVNQKNYLGAVIGIVSDGNEFKDIGDLLP
ncbi:hypothetical protein [Colwellia sp. RSH04]|uniref:hypothetical protein n=1 Tax=Colwellia sp. RSH04 TaxID=2305464 RepID=UPI000E577583|nr:hypothetical protein [Colwellia sp. RSH04]RHW75162.1 hypothetical protein D1094_14990 [Colwellia sp. RSH04]